MGGSGRSEREHQILFFKRPKVYHRSPDSDERRYKLKDWKRRVDPTERADGSMGALYGVCSGTHPNASFISLVELVSDNLTRIVSEKLPNFQTLPNFQNFLTSKLQSMLYHDLF